VTIAWGQHLACCWCLWTGKSLHQQNVFLSLEPSSSVWEDVECKLRCVNFRRVSDSRRAYLLASTVTGSAGDQPWSVNEKPGRTWKRQWQTWKRRHQTSECRQHVWDHLESQWSILEITISSLGTLLVHLGIVAITYPSTIFKTHVFRLYFHLCIYVSIATHQHTVNLHRLQVELENNSRCAWQWRSSELWDLLQGCDWANLEIDLEAMIKRVCRCTWRALLCELQGYNRATLEIPLEAVIVRTWRLEPNEFGYTLGSRDREMSQFGGCDPSSLEVTIEPVWMPKSSGFRGCNRASLDEHWAAIHGHRAGCWESIPQ
jgi:hypothetical protein